MNRPVHLMLAALALAAGVLAAAVENPQPPLRDDEVAAIDLAIWIRDQRAGLLVLDTRAVAAAEERIAGSQSLALLDGGLPPADLVVVYADAQIGDAAFAALRQRYPGLPLRRLRGGIEAWNSEVLFPVLRDDAPMHVQRAFAPRADLSRYFGGAPQRGVPDVRTLHQRSRRGC
ncbi:MAG: hypothetical protein JNN30_10995 [Rhodanobacteraceae bacterium]|nr:hypothetical protein [Rhodanobacteraceae bacterium]